MKKLLLSLALVLALASRVVASDANPCGNHGNHCCTNDGGSTVVGVSEECQAFCSSTSMAVSVAVSECEAKATASCRQECGDAVSAAVSVAVAGAESDATAACAQTCALQVTEAVTSAVASATAACSQECQVPTCLDWKVRYDRNGRPVRRICKKVLGQ